MSALQRNISAVCRVCLADNVKLLSIADSNLVETYEIISWSKLYKDGKPTTVCYICASQLRKCKKLSDMAQKSEVLLEDLMKEGFEDDKELMPLLSLYNLTITPVNATSVGYDDENIEINEEIVKKEDTDGRFHINFDVDVKIKRETAVEKEVDDIPTDTFEDFDDENCADDITPSILQNNEKNNEMCISKCGVSKICDENLNKEHDLLKHKQIHKEFACNVCTKTFTLKKYLNTHIRKVHNKEKRFACETCSESYNIKCNYDAHMKTHIGEKPYKCDICDRGFNTKGHLNRHIKIHNGEKTHSCTECDKKFAQKIQLTLHMRSHTGERPYSCDRCGKTFSQRGSLLHHIMNIHTDEKPYVCNICNKRYVIKSLLTKHMKSHTGDKPFICESCGKAYPEKSSLKIHMKNHTGKPYICNICYKSFPMKCYMLRHIKITHHGVKQHSCSDCGKLFANTGALNSHMRTHTGEKPYICNICDKNFASQRSLKLHMRVHSGERPFACDRCGLIFSMKCSLNSHMKTHNEENK